MDWMKEGPRLAKENERLNKVLRELMESLGNIPPGAGTSAPAVALLTCECAVCDFIRDWLERMRTREDEEDGRPSSPHESAQAQFARRVGPPERERLSAEEQRFLSQWERLQREAAKSEGALGKGRAVREIVAGWLKENGYDGLYATDRACCCAAEALMPCGLGCIAKCKPGHRVASDCGDNAPSFLIIAP